MSSAAELLDGLGRPGSIRLGGGFAVQPSRLHTGIVPLDQLLGGGLPRGRITEVFGRPSAGCTALVTRIAASVTHGGEPIAWIDPLDQLDPDGLATGGVLLAGVLWLRPKSFEDALRAADLLLRTGGFGLVALHLDLSARCGAARWRRLQQAVEQGPGRSVLLVSSLARVPDSGAALVLELMARRARWTYGAGQRLLLEGIDTHLTVVRSRFSHVGNTMILPWRTAA